ncbi:MAG: DUF3343 domain-containing protein [Treponema sp.]|jgi:hypothetical protein|nr:DUF3343 domain-containing protein [Treponema sp.]
MKNSNAQDIIVGFESVSQAIRAEQALTEQGIPVRVMPMPASIRAGCGFCLRFFPADRERAAAFLVEQGMNSTEAWEQAGDGSYRKIAFIAENHPDDL